MGAGQFCTNPGLPLARNGAGLGAFIAGASEALGAAGSATMLTPGIFAAYQSGVERLGAHPKVRIVRQGPIDHPSLARPDQRPEPVPQLRPVRDRGRWQDHLHRAGWLKNVIGRVSTSKATGIDANGTL
jgi:hypothetical protein